MIRLIFSTQISYDPQNAMPAGVNQRAVPALVRERLAEAADEVEEGSQRAAVIAALAEGSAIKTPRRTVPVVGRNEPCPCGSRKKFKLCHGR